MRSAYYTEPAHFQIFRTRTFGNWRTGCLKGIARPLMG